MSTAILWAIGILFLLLCATIMFLLFYSGLLHRIEFKAGTPPVGKLRVAYKFGRGEYSSVGEYFSEISKLVPSTYRSFGMYYDDPAKVPSGKCRYIIGAIMTEGDEESDKELEAKLSSSGYKFHIMPEVTNMVHTIFPNKSFLSVIIGMQRVYPAFNSYIEESGVSAHPLFEIYDKDVIYFLAPLAKQSEFYVPEARSEKLKKDSDAENESHEESLDDGNSNADGSDGSNSGEDSGSSFEELDASHVIEEGGTEVMNQDESSSV